LNTSSVIRRTKSLELKGKQFGWNQIWLKDETQQITGAFKFRGVLNHVSSLPYGTELVTASTGNHGIAVAEAARLSGSSAHIFVPENTSKVKLNKLKKRGANVIVNGAIYDDCEAQARSFAQKNNFSFIHSFESPKVIEGHQSLFKEIRKDCPDFQTIFVPVGGGGLLSACINEFGDSSKKIIGVEFTGAPALHSSLIKKKRISVTTKKSWAEGLTVSLIGKPAFELCLSHCVPVVLVSEIEMEQAIRILWQRNNIRAEYAGAAPLAAAIKHAEIGKESICVISGGNIDNDIFHQICNNTI